MSADASALLGGRYELQGRIGAGGFSEVWRAHDCVLDRPVAIKLLDAKYARDAEGLARFRGEAHNAGCLSHANIARIYDFGEPDPPEPPYLVMELVAGPTLADVLREGPVEPAWCMDIIGQAAAGLHEAHLHGLVHRDVKPGNILLGPEGVKVADFGIAHSLDSAALTSTGIVIGSPGYVAPERAAGARATPASDLYALGVVAYECLTGTPPFSGTSLEVAFAHVNQPFPALPAHVPDDVAAFVEQLTSKDPAQRPPDAAAVADQAARLRASLIPASLIPASRPGSRAGVGASAAVPAWDHAGVGVPERTAADGAAHGRLHARNAGGRGPAMSARGRVVAAGAVAACLLAGLVLFSLFAPGIAHSAASARHRPGSGAGSDQLNPSAATVSAVVHSRSLLGQPVARVVERLRDLGLATRVIWRPAAGAPGTVVAVYPRGRRPVGSLITVVGARKHRQPHQVHSPGLDRCKGDGQGAAMSHGKGHDASQGRGHGKVYCHGRATKHQPPAGGTVNSGDGNSQGDG